jgi:hypothetical protein
MLKYCLKTTDLTTGMLICTKKEMKIAVENFIQILSLQFPGKKKMTTSELNGISFSTRRRSTNLNKIGGPYKAQQIVLLTKKISYQQNKLKSAETLARKGFPAKFVLTIFL